MLGFYPLRNSLRCVRCTGLDLACSIASSEGPFWLQDRGLYTDGREAIGPLYDAEGFGLQWEGNKTHIPLPSYIRRPSSRLDQLPIPTVCLAPLVVMNNFHRQFPLEEPQTAPRPTPSLFIVINEKPDFGTAKFTVLPPRE